MAIRVFPGDKLDLALEKSERNLPGVSVHPFRHEKQRPTNWCWAACISNGASVFGDARGHSEMAEEVTGCLDCYPANPGECCDVVWKLQHLEEAWSKCGYSAQLETGHLSLDELKVEIASNRPVQVHRESDVHYVLIVGWYLSGGVEMLVLGDPKFLSTRDVPYQALKDGVDEARWTSTVRNIHPKGS